MENTYEFTPEERAYFQRVHEEFQFQVTSGIRMIVTQQKLPGNWRVRADGAGLENVDEAAGLPAPAPVLVTAPTEDQKANGLA